MFQGRIAMSSFLKAIALFLIIAPSAMVAAAPSEECAQYVKNARDLAGKIAWDASSFWAHRQKFLEITITRANGVRGDAQERLAGDEKNAVAEMGRVKERLPQALAEFQAALETIRSRECLPAAQLRAMEEESTDVVRNVKFDQLPQMKGQARTP
jgi:hypothetical protein